MEQLNNKFDPIISTSLFMAQLFWFLLFVCLCCSVLYEKRQDDSFSVVKIVIDIPKLEVSMIL